MGEGEVPPEPRDFCGLRGGWEPRMNTDGGVGIRGWIEPRKTRNTRKEMVFFWGGRSSI